MTPAIEKILEEIAGREGGFVNHPDDRGGPTNWGVTQATLSKYRGRNVTIDEVRALTRAEALELLRAQYVTDPGFDRVAAISPEIAAEVVDTGVNMGQGVASIFLQRALNAFNLRGELYPDVKADGRIGGVTIAALRSFLASRQRDGVTVLLRAMNAQQGARYLDLVERRQANESFVFGWFRNRVS